jgi:aminomethyltransferase
MIFFNTKIKVMKHTALIDEHKKLNARLVEFAGFEMPVEYTGVKEEHMAVRQAAGIFDVSHMGEFWIKGPDAIKVLQRVTTNDVRRLTPGKAQYTCMPNGKGGIIDDLLVYQYEEEKYMLVVNAANIQKDWDWISSHNDWNQAEMDNASDRMSLLAVQGPKAAEILQRITDINLHDIKFYNFVTGNIGGVDDVIISATGYTGAGGFELYCENDYAALLWRKILEVGVDDGLKPAGLAARDTLRLEMGLCLYGNDLDETTSPIEAGLGWITKFKEDKNFIDEDFLKKQKEEGVSKKLIGFKMNQRAIPRHNYPILNENGDEIGHVTSGTMSPVLNQGIGLGYIKKEYSSKNMSIYIKIRNKSIEATVTKVPFI